MLIAYDIHQQHVRFYAHGACWLRPTLSEDPNMNFKLYHIQYVKSGLLCDLVCQHLHRCCRVVYIPHNQLMCLSTSSAGLLPDYFDQVL